MGLISASILAYRIKQAKSNITAYGVQLTKAENNHAQNPTPGNAKTQRYYELIVEEYKERLSKLEQELSELNAKGDGKKAKV